jgi:hypothetical protein
LNKGVVSFHGGLGKDKSRPNEPITAKVLCVEQTTFESAEVIAAFNKKCAKVKPIGK